MKLYLYMPDDSPESTASAAMYLDRVTSMHMAGYLPDDATVWANATDYGLGMWALAERSTHVRVHDSIVAGWARITRTSVRFAPTLDDTTSNPTRTFDLNGVPSATDDAVSSTILVHHVQQDRRVQFVANSKVVKGVTDGRCRFDPFTVIDMNRYQGPKKANANPVEQAHAMINGVALMTQGLEPEAAQFVRDHIDAFAINLDKRSLEYTKDASSAMTAFAQRWAKQFQVNIKALGGEHRLVPAAAAE